MRVLVAGDRGEAPRKLVHDEAFIGGPRGTFPDLSLRWSVRDGVDELVGAYGKYGLTCHGFTSSRLVRLRTIRELRSAGLIDEMLRRQTRDPLPIAGAAIAQEAG